MIRSMTGYGEAERDSPAGRLRLEVRTVNHRYFNASIKTPSALQRHERDIIDALQARLPRGHVSASLTLDRGPRANGAGAEVDLERARSYRAALEALQSELGVPGAVDLAMLARFSDVFRAPVDPEGIVVDPEVMRALAEEAARAVVLQRQAEGRRLRDDLEQRLEAIRGHLAAVEARAPVRLVAERDRLREAVRALAEGVGVDEDRLAREIALAADRWDVSEETVRFRSHVELFAETLRGEGGEPVGKRLGFLAQEMHREANTIGAKANDAELAHAAVSLKEEIERIREQVENVE